MRWKVDRNKLGETHYRRDEGGRSGGRTASVVINKSTEGFYEVNGVVIERGFQDTTHVVLHKKSPKFKSKVVAKRYLWGLKRQINHRFFR